MAAADGSDVSENRVPNRELLFSILQFRKIYSAGRISFTVSDPDCFAQKRRRRVFVSDSAGPEGGLSPRARPERSCGRRGDGSVVSAPSSSSHGGRFKSSPGGTSKRFREGVVTVRREREAQRAIAMRFQRSTLEYLRRGERVARLEREAGNESLRRNSKSPAARS